MLETPKGLRVHIAVTGRRNAGKSALINALAGQDVSIVSPVAGATTDPVEKTLELPGFGASVLIDTAGLDDGGALGALRVARSQNILRRANLAILLTAGAEWGETEKKALADLAACGVPCVIARNKTDIATPPDKEEWREALAIPRQVPITDISARTGAGLDELLDILKSLHSQKNEPQKPLLADLAPPDSLVVLVAPIDSGAPKGRLILPQVQALRDCLDGGQTAVLLTEAQYPALWPKLAARPALVVCDSQVVKFVAAETPPDIPLTTFSILMARFKGNLTAFAKGAAALKSLKPGDVVCVAEACSHHPLEDDIGRVKIPALLRRMAGGDINVVFAQGKEMGGLPENAKAIVHCGACVITRKQMLARQDQAASGGMPMTNYGMAISLAQGVLDRTLAPFPEAWRAFHEGDKKSGN